MLRSAIFQRISIAITTILGLAWGWNHVHWQAAELINEPSVEVVRWNYPNQPCDEIIGYFHGRPYSSSTRQEMKENGLLLQACWSELQRNGSRDLLLNAAGSLIPSEYSSSGKDPVGLVQQFYPSLVLPGNTSPDDPERILEKLADRILNGENTEQIRALGYSCQNPRLAGDVKERTKERPPLPETRSWYVLQMLEHCSRNDTDRKRYMKEQWNGHPEAHGFLMLEWHLYHGELPAEFKPSADPFERSVFNYLSDMSNTTTH